MNTRNVKILFLIALIVTTSFSVSNAFDWKVIKTGNNFAINDVHFINDSLGFAVSKSGNLLKVLELPHNWAVSIKKFDCAFEGVYFLEDGSKGFAFGANGLIYSTNDTGQTWDVDSMGMSLRFYDMLFTDSLNGIIVGNNFTQKLGASGIAFQTHDGGKTWDSLGINGWRFTEINKSVDNIITITGRQKLLISTDNGKSWDFAAVKSNLTPTSTVLLGQYGMMVGMGGYFANSSDSGRTWTQIDALPPTYSLFDIYMFDRLKAVTVGVKGYMFYTDDAGHNWIPLLSAAGEDLFKLVRAGNRIFACGNRGAIVYSEIELPIEN